MNASPHGASVVPSVAVAIRIASRPVGIDGTTDPDSAAPQSGLARMPAAMYATNTADSASSTRSTPRNPPRSTSVDTISAEIGTEMYRLTPKIWNPAAMPANSAVVVPMFASSSAAIDSTPARAPYRCRIRPARPWPVTTPMRAPRSWNRIRATVETVSTHSRR